MSTSFISRKKQEKEYFHKVLDFFEKQNMVYKDVSENTSFFEKDIDILLFMNDVEISVEVKIDSWIGKTSNFFFEIISNEEKGTLGCFLKSQAHIWLYVDTKNDILYFFPLDKVRKWFYIIRKNLKGGKEYKKFEDTFPLRATSTESEKGIFSHTTIGRLVNKKYLLGGLRESGIGYIQKNLLDDVSQEEIQKLIR